MKRNHKETLKSILKVLCDGKEYSYGSIERKANTNWKTVRDHVELLVLIEAATISKDNKVKINQNEYKLLNKL